MVFMMVMVVLPPFTAAKPFKIPARCSCASHATWAVMESSTALRETLQMRLDVSHDDHDGDYDYDDCGGDGHDDHNFDHDDLDGGGNDHDKDGDDHDHFFHDASDETGCQS